MEKESRLYFYAKDINKLHNPSNLKLKSSESVFKKSISGLKTFNPQGLTQNKNCQSQVHIKSPQRELQSAIAKSIDSFDMQVSKIYGYMQGDNS